MTEEQIINGYWIGLHRTKNPAKHLHTFYRELFGQPFHRANLMGMYKLVKDYGEDIVFKSICDLLDWSGFIPTRNVIPALVHIAKRRYTHKQASESQPEMVDLTSYMRDLANVR